LLPESLFPGDQIITRQPVLHPASLSVNQEFPVNCASQQSQYWGRYSFSPKFTESNTYLLRHEFELLFDPQLPLTQETLRRRDLLLETFAFKRRKLLNQLEDVDIRYNRNNLESIIEDFCEGTKYFHFSSECHQSGADIKEQNLYSTIYCFDSSKKFPGGFSSGLTSLNLLHEPYTPDSPCPAKVSYGSIYNPSQERHLAEWLFGDTEASMQMQSQINLIDSQLTAAFEFLNQFHQGLQAIPIQS
jgi:hypothetical protein